MFIYRYENILMFDSAVYSRNDMLLSFNGETL